jgi:hypothetical protein
MNNKRIGVIIIILGVLLAAVSLLADVLGLGGDPNAFGWKQLLGTGVGVLVVIIGVWFLGRKEDGEA